MNARIVMRRMFIVIGAAAAAAAVSAVASCNGRVADSGSPGEVVDAAPKSILPKEPVIGGVMPAVASGYAHAIRPVDPTLPIRLTLALRPKRAELQAFVQAVRDRRSPRYGKFLTSDEAKAMFAPSSETIDEVEAWSTGIGLHEVQRFATDYAIIVEGTVGAVNSALEIKLNQYEVAGHTFYANDRAPTIPSNISSKLTDVFGLESGRQMTHGGSSRSFVDIPAPSFNAGPPVVATINSPAPGGAPHHPEITGGNPLMLTPNTAIEPSDLWSSQGYNFGPLRSNFAHCCNPTSSATGGGPVTGIAFVEEANPLSTDIGEFFTFYHIAGSIQLVSLSLAGGSDGAGEASLDIEWASAVANPPDSAGSLSASQMVSYANGPTTAGTYAAWQQADSDGLARTFSSSLAAGEAEFAGTYNLTAFDETAEDMAVKGWTLVAAAGDQGVDYLSGTSTVFGANYPSSDPNFVSVGGTNLVLATSAATSPPTVIGQWEEELPWNLSQGAAGGGGCSAYFPSPSWQAEIVSGTSAYCIGQAGTNHRIFPDLALNAAGGPSQNSGQVVYDTLWTTLAGTSVAAPEVAGFAVLVNSYQEYISIVTDGCQSEFRTCQESGFVSPNSIWDIGSNTSGGGVIHNPFYDIKDRQYLSWQYLHSGSEWPT